MFKNANSDKRIYFDYASTTPLDEGVFEKMIPYFKENYGNPSSMHQSGRVASQAIFRARSDVAKILNVSKEEIIFTGSGTESNNLAIFGILNHLEASLPSTWKRSFQVKPHLITTEIEHSSVLECFKKLEKRGFSVSYLKVDKYGLVNPKDLEKAIRPETALVSVMYANNEIGTIQPIKKLSKIVKEHRGSKQFPLFHTDACQVAGFLMLDVKELGVDLMTLNGSKIYGPKGVGILYKRKDIKIEPLIVGGGQEMNMRAGTENVPYIVGFVEALKKVVVSREKESKRLTGLRDYFIKRLIDEIPDVVINGHRKKRLPNNIHISIPNVEGESAILMLDKYGIEASTGSACSTNDLKPSHVVFALGQNAELAHNSVRFTLGKFSDKKEIDYTMSVFPKIVAKLKKMSALATK